MKIIDNKKDYYDYLVGINGLDSDTIYDRRGSLSLKNDEWFNGSHPKLGAALDASDQNSYRGYYFPDKRKKPNYKNDESFPAYGRLDYIYLAIGNTIYVILTDRYIMRDNDNNRVIGGSNQIIEKINRGEDGVFCPVGLITRYHLADQEIVISDGEFKGEIILSVVLEGTWLTKLFPAEKVWEDVYNYIRSKKEKIIIDNRTDKEKIISAGFDVKSSFRNIKD